MNPSDTKQLSENQTDASETTSSRFGRSKTVIESALELRVLKRAFSLWASYAVIAFFSAAVVGHGLVSVTDALIGVPFAWLSGWLWQRHNNGASAAAIVFTALLALIGVVAGAV